VQELDIAGIKLLIRQFSWHEANANKVWPGTFTLAEYIVEHLDTYRAGVLLELGAATGALALFLRQPQYNLNVITSDISDGGAVRENIAHNFALNGVPCVTHVEHTWGGPWPEQVAAAASITHVIASDILLYVKAYPALVATLDMLFKAGAVQFLMSWNRRINSTPVFFALMQEAGFIAETLPHCVYSFTRPLKAAAASEQV
jgi:predicted nicotinamide N-methyase